MKTERLPKKRRGERSEIKIGTGIEIEIKIRRETEIGIEIEKEEEIETPKKGVGKTEAERNVHQKGKKMRRL